MLSKATANKIGKQVSLQRKELMRSSSSINKVIMELLESSSKAESDLRISMFAKNLDYLREKHEERNTKINHFINRMRSASINSDMPLKEILRQFVSSTRLGFDQRLTAEALFYVSATLKSFGLNPNHYFDYNVLIIENISKG